MRRIQASRACAYCEKTLHALWGGFHLNSIKRLLSKAFWCFKTILEFSPQAAHLVGLRALCVALIRRHLPGLDPLIQAVLADAKPDGTSATLWPRSVICLTASVLNSSGYLSLLMAPPIGPQV
jgi:hypothetical protein